ncbi:MAG: 2,3-bisphosphoglycerate-independent phosphoglycerate mutase [bacterium]|nr:2,3-bisphosphoglycerate-independent phosphoglycerate mutase [bacterium]
MKYVVCVPDGCADWPVPALDGRTPLEAAHMPTLARLAARAHLGRARVIPEGLPAGSDVGNMSIFGYDPATYHNGRASIEAAAMGLRLAGDQVAYRCNLATVTDDGVMADFAGGHPPSESAAEVIAALQAELGGEVVFHAGVQYRHIMVAPATWADADCTPPHDISGQQAVLPTGPAAPRLRALMQASRDVLARFDIEATQVWFWGQGTSPQMPSFADRYGKAAGLVSAVDLVRGLGVLTGMEVVSVPGATAWYDTNYEGKRDAVLAGLEAGADLFVLHVEASDEAGHAGDVDEKVKSLENWDRRILTDLVAGLDSQGPWRMLLLPDHATPLELRTHTAEPVPYMLFDSQDDGPGGSYTEPATATAPVVAGHTLMGELLRP